MFRVLAQFTIRASALQMTVQHAEHLFYTWDGIRLGIQGDTRWQIPIRARRPPSNARSISLNTSRIAAMDLPIPRSATSSPSPRARPAIFCGLWNVEDTSAATRHLGAIGSA